MRTFFLLVTLLALIATTGTGCGTWTETEVEYPRFKDGKVYRFDAGKVQFSGAAIHGSLKDLMDTHSIKQVVSDDYLRSGTTTMNAVREELHRRIRLSRMARMAGDFYVSFEAKHPSKAAVYVKAVCRDEDHFIEYMVNLAVASRTTSSFTFHLVALVTFDSSHGDIEYHDEEIDDGTGKGITIPTTTVLAPADHFVPLIRGSSPGVSDFGVPLGGTSGMTSYQDLENEKIALQKKLEAVKDIMDANLLNEASVLELIDALKAAGKDISDIEKQLARIRGIKVKTP